MERWFNMKERNWKLFFERLWKVYAALITAFALFIYFSEHNPIWQVMDKDIGAFWDFGNIWDTAFPVLIVIYLPVALSKAIQWVWGAHKVT